MGKKDSHGSPGEQPTGRSFSIAAVSAVAIALMTAPANATPPTATANFDLYEIGFQAYGFDLNPQAPIVATLHGVCTFTTDPHIFLEAPNPLANGATRPPSGTIPDYVMRCEQTISFVPALGEAFGARQVQLEGIVDQVSFEVGVPSLLSVTGGTGPYQKSRGQATVTQLIFPNIKRLQLTVYDVQ